MEINFTHFRVYRECPWKFKLLYRDGERIAPSPAASLGLTLHRALEAFHREGGDDLKLLLSLYRDHWVDAGFEDPALGKTWRRKGRRMLERFFADERGRRTRIEGVEREFLYPLGRHSVRGMIDRIDQHPDGRFEIIDYKTGAEVMGSLEESLQLRFYALGAKEGLGIEPSIITFHYLASGKTASVDYDPGAEEALKADILRAADAIEKGAFPPDTGFCPRCGLRKTCLYWRG